MKNRVFAALATLAVLSLSAGCAHGQDNPTPPVITLPTPGNGSYTPLNPAGTPSLTYTDSPSGQVGYVVQGYLPASGSTPAQYGQWSNVVGPVTGGSTGKVTLTWTCTASAGQTCSGVQWIVSRASAVTALAPGTPAANAPTTSMLDNEKYTDHQPTMASNIPSVALKLERK